MKVDRYEGSQERRIVTGMIVDKVVLAKIADKWQKDLFESPWSNLIGSWCVKYFQRYGEAPGKAIEGLFESWVQDNAYDKATGKLVESFLAGLSGEYEQLSEESNSDFILDLAGAYFNRVRLKRLAEAIQGDLDGGDLEKAQTRVNTFGKLEIGVGAGVDLLCDEEAIRLAFEDKQEPLIKYPGAVGEFFGDALERDGLVAFMAPEKRGKSFMLNDVAWRAMLQRRKVALFGAGDMSLNQTIRRLMIRAARRPLKPKKILYPKVLVREKGVPHATVEHEEREFKDELDWREAWNACQEIMKSKTKTKESLLKVSCHPNSTLSVSSIQSILQGWERQGWVPDVIVIDYADILAPIYGNQETRDQINSTWKALRALSQENHCLVVTATQADAASYNATLLTRSNFTDDKRKNAHVTGMVGINATDEEKSVGVFRLNWIQRRESAFSERHCVYVAGCLDIGNPCLRSCW